MMLSKIKDGLNTYFMGREIYYFKELTSTNDLAKKLASNGAYEGVVVISEKQSLGRGRLRRRWISPNGGIWFSVILRPKISSVDAFKLTFLTAVAVVKAMKKAFKIDAEIKWPNDVLINDKKVCGILTEMSTSRNIIDYVVIGIGINANVDMNSFPRELRSAVTSLKKEVKEEVEREEFLQVLLRELELYYKMFLGGKFNSILEEWKALNRIFNEYVEVLSPEEKFTGQAVNVDKDGALIIKLEDGSIRKIIPGNTTLKRPKT